MGKKKVKISIEIKDDRKGMLMPVLKPNQVHKDKQKYTRKCKHKNRRNYD